MTINYEYYQIFYYVAESKSFTAAASQLYLSQSTVSRAIQNLEKDLGCTLFLRSRQGVCLTEEGTYLFNHVKKAFSFISHAEHHLHDVSKLHEGFLRIGATELTLQHFLLPYLESFEKEYPNIHINLSFQYPKKVCEQLDSGLLDITFLTTPFDIAPSILKQELVEFSEILIGGTKYWRLARNPADFHNLKDESFIAMEEGTSASTFFHQICIENKVEIIPKYQVCSTPLVVSMVERNFGIGFVPDVYAEEKLKSGDLFEISLRNPPKKRQICALTSKMFPYHSVRDVFLSKFIISG